MGFRSTFVTIDDCTAWPGWFTTRWGHVCHINPGGRGVLSSKAEGKTYGVWDELPTDIQRALDWTKRTREFALVYLHECGGVTRVSITADRVTYSEPGGWTVVPDVTHNYCYGCSTPSEVQP